MPADDIQDPVAIARDVLRTEREGLQLLSDGLSETFAAVIGCLRAVTGRVIVSGIGKSGHVANKIAATLASTGTPAQYVHPSEASHGDMGMITRGDAVLAISNSGETRELADIISYTRRFSIPLVAITRDPDSSLAVQSDFVLKLPDAPEACAIGMAPTTSTTCSMALGDALAVVLMRLNGFERDMYHDFHPGGSLGARLLKVGEIMHQGADLPLVTPQTPMGETLVEMTAKGFGVAAVVEAGRLVGVITDGDLRRNLSTLMSRSAGDVATRDPRTIAPSALMSEALAYMTENRISALCVVDGDRHMLGLVHVHDALRVGVV